MRNMEIIHPPEWVRLRGYSHGVVAQGRTVYLAGQVGVAGKLGWQPETADALSLHFAEQFRQVLTNIVDLLDEAGARPEHIVETDLVHHRQVSVFRRTRTDG